MARMGEVFLRFGQPVLPRNASFAQLDTKGVVVQSRQPGCTGGQYGNGPIGEGLAAALVLW